MNADELGDAWRYCDPIKLADPAATHALVQAALGTFLTIRFALANIDPERMATEVDWRAIQYELKTALKLAGHPSGDLPPAA